MRCLIHYNFLEIKMVSGMELVDQIVKIETLMVIIASKQARNFYWLTEAGYIAAKQLMWACGITACSLRVTSENSFTDLERMES